MPSSWDPATDLAPYIETHLAYELKYLVVAATTWTAVRAESDRAAWPDHLVVMSMESALVHTRTLSEFLLLEQGWANRSPHNPPDLPTWEILRHAVNTRVLHPSPTRPQGSQQRRGSDLKDRVLDLAREVLAAWDSVAAQQAMAMVRAEMVAARASAIADGTHAARRLRVSCPLH